MPAGIAYGVMKSKDKEYNTKLYNYLVKRIAWLETERSSFDPHWKEISEYIRPRRGRFFVTDANKGSKKRRYQAIINSTGTRASRVSKAGLLSGIMSPSRPWFSLEVPDPKLMDMKDVRVWLKDVETEIRGVFNRSNLYNMAPVMLGELLDFGTGVMLHDDDTNDIARFYALTVGSYWLAQNEKFEIDTLVRRFQLPVNAIVGKFGLDNVTPDIRRSWENANYDKMHTIIHVVEPRKDRSHDNPFNTNKAFRSVYFEFGDESVNSYQNNSGGQTGGGERILKESGFDVFPAYCPRWATTVEDIYGTDCPGMIALGDVKQLQMQERRKAQAIEKLVNPPLVVPSSLRETPVNALPGGITAADLGPDGKNTITSLYNVNPQVQHMVEDIKTTEKRIEDDYYMDLFFAITNMEGVQPRNELELAERNQERLLQLGPVLEQLHGEFLDKLIDRTFSQIVKAGTLPEPPPELEGQTLEVKYVSSLAQAQKAVITGSIERITGFAANMSQFDPSIIDKIDFDKVVDEFAEVTDVPPNIIRDDESVAAIREQRAQQQQQQQQLEQAQMEAGAMKDMAKAEKDATE